MIHGDPQVILVDSQAILEWFSNDTQVILADSH